MVVASLRPVPAAGPAVSRSPGAMLAMSGSSCGSSRPTTCTRSWAYAWALVAPTAVGLGMLFYGMARGDGELVRDGLRMTATGIALFFGFALFFEGVIGLSGQRFLNVRWRTCRPGLSASGWCSSCCRYSRNAAQKSVSVSSPRTLLTTESLRARYGVLKLRTVRRLSWLIVRPVSTLRSQLLVTRVIVRLAGGDRRRGPGDQPGDRLQVGPPLPARRPAGLADRSSRPHRSPGRRRRPRSSGSSPLGRVALGSRSPRAAARPPAVDRRGGSPPHGVPRLADLDRPTGLPVRRYEACHPGALVHQDHKKLAGSPTAAATGPSAGHRGPATASRRTGYDHFEVSSTTAAGARSWSRSPTRAPPVRRRARAGPDNVRSRGHRRRAGHDRQRLGIPLERRIGRSSASGARAGRGRIDRRPTARPSGSSGHSSASGRTPDLHARTPRARRPAGLRRLLQSAPPAHRARRPLPLGRWSTTSVVITSSRAVAGWGRDVAACDCPPLCAALKSIASTL